MDFIVISAEGAEKGYLPSSAVLDFELGTDNGDLQLTVPHGVIEEGDFVVCFGTEYGAVMEESIMKTDLATETWYGHSFRKLLEQVIIMPNPGQDYRTVSGDANSILRELLQNQMGNFFHVSEDASSIWIQDYQFPRYCTLLDGISTMLSASRGKLRITITEPLTVTVSADMAFDYSDSIEFSEDSHAVVTLTRNQRGINHLICLGSGKLNNRQVIHLYAWPDGSVKNSPFWTGFHERTAVYDYSSAENTDDLIKQGAKHLQQLANKETASVSVSDTELDIGDIVSGRSYGTGRIVQAPIVSKIIQINEDGTEITYKTKGES